MAWAHMQLLLCGAMLLLSGYLKRHISVGFSEMSCAVSKGDAKAVVGWSENDGRIPVGSILLCVSFSSRNRKYREQKIRLNGLEPGERRTVYAAATALECGTYTVEWRYVYLWDYLKLFRRKKKSEGHAEWVVFPSEKSLYLPAILEKAGRQSQFFFNTAYDSGNDRDELRQLREYVPGDPSRLIHWKLSARMDKPVIREYVNEQGRQLPLLLVMRFEQGISRVQREAFYEIVSALLVGLLEKGVMVSVNWIAEFETVMNQRVENLEDLRNLLLTFYHQEAYLTNIKEVRQPGLRFGTDLRLMLDDELLFIFSAEEYCKEPEQLAAW